MVEKINTSLIDPQFPASVPNDYQGKSSAISGVDFFSLTQADKAKESNNAGLKDLDFASWEDILKNATSGSQTVPLQPPFLERQPDTIGVLGKQENQKLGQLFTNNFGERQEFGGRPQAQEEWKNSEGNWPLDQDVHMESVYGVASRLHEQDVNQVNVLNCLEPCLALTDEQENFPMQDDLQGQLPNAEHSYYLDSVSLGWMSMELGDVNESHMQSSSGAYCDSVEVEIRVDESSISPQVHFENYTLGPTLSQDQLFSILDISPNWTYEGSEIEVLIMGTFLKNQQEAENCEWSCMFGEVEVPAEVIADGVLRCHTPIHKAARVPFYVTRSNRLACSKVREFEYRFKPAEDADIIDNYSDSGSVILQMRLVELLCLSSVCPPNPDYISLSEESQLSNKISSLLKKDGDEWHQMLELDSPERVKEKMLEKLLKEKLHIWLLQKAAEGGKGPSVLDKGGQGVLHFAAALGYDWALEPTILAGVSVNFRDVNGWTALHWAAFCGRTPADLAYANGHKGLAGYLTASALSAYLSSLKLDTKDGDATEIPGAKAVQTVSERSATPISDGDLPDGLSLKDSLAAVCNATQAAARIHQVYRMQSFQKKQLKEYGDDAFGMSEEEQALSFLAVKTHKSVQHDLPVHAAAIRIQKKFRCWKRDGSGLRGFKSEALTGGRRMEDTSSKEDDYDFLKEGRKQTEERLILMP
ncbi:hypothetical protein FH972_002650 [Carpinus fangiana]|uniref:IPT/TIG domain-containing protein n=1 Tax=Carpinus fangiana TaxID=176857 RepID=A0A5N6QFH8_9ROSI|nr:hypothetical protein FH972_002650 [Carpinus fangiana]